jgi:hypothetical protein
MPAKAGIQNGAQSKLDSRLRGNDGEFGMTLAYDLSMFFRARSSDEAKELAEDLAKAMSGPKTRIALLRGGPMDGAKVDVSQIEVDQGMMASCHRHQGKIVHGQYRPSDEANVWRYTSL